MDQKAPRKHVATGRPRGGARPGGGRPPGSRNVLPFGAVDAINAAVVAQRRIGKDDPEALATVERAVERIADVMEERVHFQSAGSVLKAATTLADFVAGGPQKQHVDVSGKLSLEALVLGSMEDDAEVGSAERGAE